MTAFSNFIDFVKLAVNESDSDLDILVPRAVQQAILAIERAADLGYMRSTEYSQMKNWEFSFSNEVLYPQVEVNAAQETGILFDSAAAPGDQLRLNIPVAPTTPNVSFDGFFEASHAIHMIFNEPGPLRDFVRDRIFKVNFLAVLTPAQTTYKLLNGIIDVTGVDLSVFESEAMVTLPSGKRTFAQYPDDDTFSVKAFPRQPFDLPDPGLLVFSGKVKAINQVDLANDADFREILRKDLPRFDARRIDPVKDSWVDSTTGTLPEAYDFFVQADRLDQKIRGNVTVSGQRSALIFREIPDKEYWVKAEVKRYTQFPVDDHPLFYEHEDLLLSQSIVQMAPWLRDVEQMQLHGQLVQSKINLIKAENAYTSHSGLSRKLEYDPYR